MTTSSSGVPVWVHSILERLEALEKLIRDPSAGGNQGSLHGSSAAGRRWITVNEAAEQLGVRPGFLRRKIQVFMAMHRIDVELGHSAAEDAPVRRYGPKGWKIFLDASRLHEVVDPQQKEVAA